MGMLSIKIGINNEKVAVLFMTPIIDVQANK